MNQSINTNSKNSKEPQQKYRLGTVSIKILGGLNRFYRRLTSPSASIMAQIIQLFGPRGGFLTHQAYLKVSLDVVVVLVLDHFFDALPEAEIRMCLREVGPTTLADAEKTAVRIEAKRIEENNKVDLWVRLSRMVIVCRQAIKYH